MENVCDLNVTEVAEALALGSADQILIIDCRSFMAFNQARIVDSINIHCPPILKRRSGGFIALENIVPCEEKRSQLLRGEFPFVVVYDDNTQELNQASGDSNLLSVIRSLLKQVDNLTVRFIIGGFEAVRDQCPVLCVNQDSHLTHCMRDKVTNQDTHLSHCMRDIAIQKDKRRNQQQSEPAEILPHLYLGDVSHSSQRTVLDHLGITALLNVSSCCGNLFQTHYRYKNIQINDDMDADLISWFPEVIEFIDSVAAEKGKVLVHCRAGVSRSATVCIAYIMQKQGLSLDSAFEFVMSRRPIIDPNLNFIQQLQKFEAILKSQHQLHVPATTLTCSLQARSAPPPSKSHTSSIFTFSPENTLQRLTSPQYQSMDLSPSSPPAQRHQHTFVSSQPSQPTFYVSNDSDLSPSSLSQTAASPSPIRPLTLPTARPGFLPLLQISTPLSPLQPQGANAPIGSSLLPSPSHQAPFPASPLLNIFQEPAEGSEAFLENYANAPKTPLDNRTFSFFSSDVATCQSLSIPLDMASPRQCKPATSSALDTSAAPFFGTEHSFPSVGVPHSPISPLGVPLSPLPSCG